MGCIKSKNKHLQAPWPLSSNSRQEWIAWRSCFQTYMAENYIPSYKQGNQFFKYIGHIGPEISKNFYFVNSSSQTDIETLIFKFDVYFIFGGRKKHNNEPIDEYITALKVVAEKTAASCTDRVIKEKLLQDLKAENIFQQFSEIVPSFANITNYETLSLNELTFMWEECLCPSDISEYVDLNARKRDAFEFALKKCLYCDETHERNNCTAMGKICKKCGIANHLAKCCLKSYVKDCCHCGTNHIQSRCPAFAKECSKCKKVNHFSWKCFNEIILSCDFCGGSHVSNQRNCPAINSTCSNCHKIGHYSFKCRTRKNTKAKQKLVINIHTSKCKR